MSKSIEERNAKIKDEVITRIEAMDVDKKIVFVFMKDGTLQQYFGDKAWHELRKRGAYGVIFSPDHIRVEAFSDDELACIGLRRIPEKEE